MKLLQGEHVPRLGEGWETGSGVGDVVGGVGEARVEAAEDVQDKLGVLNGMADVAEGVSEGLHAAAILDDGGVALCHGVEVMTEEDPPGLLVGAKETLDGEPKISGGPIVVGHGKVEDGVVDGVEELGADTTICLIPVGVLGTRCHRVIDVRLEAELVAHVHEEGRPSGVGVGLHR